MVSKLWYYSMNDYDLSHYLGTGMIWPVICFLHGWRPLKVVIGVWCVHKHWWTSSMTMNGAQEWKTFLGVLTNSIWIWVVKDEKGLEEKSKKEDIPFPWNAFCCSCSLKFYPKATLPHSSWLYLYSLGVVIYNLVHLLV